MPQRDRKTIRLPQQVLRRVSRVGWNQDDGKQVMKRGVWKVTCLQNCTYGVPDQRCKAQPLSIDDWFEVRTQVNKGVSPSGNSRGSERCKGNCNQLVLTMECVTITSAHHVWLNRMSNNSTTRLCATTTRGFPRWFKLTGFKNSRRFVGFMQIQWQDLSSYRSTIFSRWADTQFKSCLRFPGSLQHKESIYATDSWLFSLGSPLQVTNATALGSESMEHHQWRPPNDLTNSWDEPGVAAFLVKHRAFER